MFAPVGVEQALFVEHLHGGVRLRREPVGMRGDALLQQQVRLLSARRVEPPVAHGGGHRIRQLLRMLHLRKDVMQDDAAQTRGSVDAREAFVAEEIVRLLRGREPAAEGEGRVFPLEIQLFALLALALHLREIVWRPDAGLLLPAEERIQELREIAVLRLAFRDSLPALLRRQFGDDVQALLGAGQRHIE